MTKFRFAEKEEVAIENKRYSDRRFNGSAFETRMDPASQSMTYPTRATPVTARRNQFVSVQYAGDPNVADNTVAQATINRNSSLYRLHDVGMLPLKTYYLGLGLSPDSQNLAYNIQYVSEMREAIAAAYATQLTELPFLRQIITTTIPEMESGDAARAGFAAWYAQFMQMAMSIFAKFNTLSSEMDNLIAMGYNVEAPITTELMNLFKKANFFSLMQQIGVTIKQEYVDLKWFKVLNILNGIPSRMADDVNHPLLSIVAVPFLPQVKVVNPADNSVMFDSATDPSFANLSVTVDTETFTYPTLNALVFDILQSMDPFRILARCRSLANGTVGKTPLVYINELIAKIQLFLRACVRFKGVTTDFDTFLMVLQNNTTLNRWTIDTPFVMPSRPREQMNNVLMGLVDDIFKAYGTSGNLRYDENTRKWDVRTMWSESSGIVQYDYYDGGFNISTSVRNIPAGDYRDIRYCFPVLFKRFVHHEAGELYQMFLSRDGSTFMMKTETLNAADMATDPSIAGLNVNSDDSLVIQRPVVELSDLTSDVVRQWSITRVMCHVFGNCRVKLGAFQYANLDPDKNFYVGRQFSKYAEDAIEFIEQNAPLRVSNGERDIGFAFRH